MVSLNFPSEGTAFNSLCEEHSTRSRCPSMERPQCMVGRDKTQGQDTPPLRSPGLRESGLALTMKHGPGVDTSPAAMPSQQ